jgi:hypothetical protein
MGGRIIMSLGAVADFVIMKPLAYRLDGSTDKELERMLDPRCHGAGDLVESKTLVLCSRSAADRKGRELLVYEMTLGADDKPASRLLGSGMAPERAGVPVVFSPIPGKAQELRWGCTEREGEGGGRKLHIGRFSVGQQISWETLPFPGEDATILGGYYDEKGQVNVITSRIEGEKKILKHVWWEGPGAGQVAAESGRTGVAAKTAIAALAAVAIIGAVLLHIRRSRKKPVPSETPSGSDSGANPPAGSRP